MGKTTCRHTIFRKSCSSCRALQSKWYSKLKSQGFEDIEYGLEHPRFIAHVPDPNAPGALESKDYYERVWAVFHAWCSHGRTKRDCRVAELFAMQKGDTGTVRGIVRELKREKLAPFGNVEVQKTLKEIHVLACSKQPITSASYVVLHHAAA